MPANRSPACKAGTPTRIDAVPALQAGKHYAGEPRACALRFTLGYNMAGFQPLGGGLFRRPTAATCSNMACKGCVEQLGAAVRSDIAAAGFQHSRAPPDGFRQPLKFSTVQKNIVLRPVRNWSTYHVALITLMALSMN